jgi:hypothetical protein
MYTLLTKAIRYVRVHGLRRTFYLSIVLLSDLWNDRRLLIRTTGPYASISYSSFRAMMKHMKIDPAKDVFIDFGAGAGRAVVLAATYPFQRVIGIEIAPELAEIARENVRRAHAKLCCPQIDILTANAIDYQIPDDASVFHFFNPFRGDTLMTVVDHIHESLNQCPRQASILFANPDDFHRHVANWSFIASQRDVLWPYFERADPDANRYRIYCIDALRELNSRSSPNQM